MFQGSAVAIVTPMHANTQIDLDSLKNLVNWQIESETQAIVVVGTTGEAPLLSDDEYEAVVSCVVEATAKRVPVIAGTGSLHIESTIEKTRKAKALGVDGALVVTPYYLRATQEGIFQHYQRLNEAVDLPFIAYNVPSRTGVDILADTVKRLSALSHCIGLKEATGSVDRMRDIKALVADDFLLYSGDDGSCFEFIEAGGHGCISVAANVAPSAMKRWCELDRRDENDLKALFDAMVLEPNPIPVKAALALMGKIDSGIRLPLTPLSEQHRPQLASAMEFFGEVYA